MLVVQKMAGVGNTNFDCLEIKTRSIEQTLLPLIKQVISIAAYQNQTLFCFSFWQFTKYNTLWKWVCTLTFKNAIVKSRSSSYLLLSSTDAVPDGSLLSYFLYNLLMFAVYVRLDFRENVSQVRFFCLLKTCDYNFLNAKCIVAMN